MGKIIEMNRRAILFLLFILSFMMARGQRNYRADRMEEILKGKENLIYSRAGNYTTALDEYDVKFYFLDLEADNTSTHISGNTTIGAIPVVQSLQTFIFELSSALSVDSILVDDVRHNFITGDDIVTVNLETSIPQGDYFSVQVFYHGTVPTQGFFAGMATGTDQVWGNQVTWTLSEPYNALGWFPCKQDLADKADSVYVFVTTDSSLLAGSNGILTNVVPIGNKTRYEWKSHHPIAYYLISITIADYRDYSIYAKPEGLNDSILIQNYIYDTPGYLTENKSLIDNTIDLIELYSDLFLLYPFYDEKYGHCVAPMGGGMEHQTMTTLLDFRFYLVAHELGHMWFGDYVTCATWMDIWINEGFASYTEYLAYQYLYSQEDADNWIINAQERAMLEPEGSVYVPFEEIENVSRIFSGNLSYKKGAAIIHMIRFELDNDSLFFKSLKEFIKQYGDSVATGLDFREVVEEVSAMDFTDFFDQWYFGRGFPTFQINWSQNADTLKVRSIQSPSSFQTSLFKTSLEFRLSYVGGDTVIRVFQDQAIQDFSFVVPSTVQSLEFDPYNWILAKVSSINYIPDLDTDPSTLFRIWPNPVSQELNIHFYGRQREHMVVISDLSGKIYSSFRTESEHITIPVGFLAPGFYTLTVEEEGKKTVQKLVKQ
ncbi:MAG: T9SS type A sorting domain-containing protein [Bacteroidales bacterium]|nr:MAG: T9SS type A sorting domain-containing protein [Bacteroidales bacterium]